MRERISMKSKMLGALALLTLIGALFIMQSAGSSPPTADAATGTIAALNVGTCLTTDGDVFKGDCKDGDNPRLSGGSGSDSWEVREEIAEVSTLYATYAHDPKTASNEPRAILTDSDLIQISIADADRDKRSGVLIRGQSYAAETTNVEFLDDDANGSLGAEIKADLEADDLDFQTGDADTNLSDDIVDIDIELTHPNDAGITIGNVATGGAIENSIIASSGNSTLNFGRADAQTEAFKPGDFNVADGAVVRFYGCINDDTDTSAPLCGDDDLDSNAATPVTDPIGRIAGLDVDEDASNGEASGNTAPWLGVNASVPSGKHIVILAIYYRTSDEEHLVGGESYYYCDSGTPTKERDDDGKDVWKCGNDDAKERNVAENATDATADVDYTDDEIDDNDALVVRAVADGSLEERSVNLYLMETARFSGVYQGFVRLTDDNGDGQDANSTPVKDMIDNWGREVDDGSSNEDSGAAIVAVESGPVTIEYRDSGGTMRRLRIEIDHQAPTINVTSPSHGSASGDQTPDFAGSLEDTESGLADNSFRLVVDNRVDSNGDARKNSDFALNGKAPDAEEVILRTATPALVQATSIGDYAGYDATNPTFGEVRASDLYNLGDDACDDDQEICHILSERYDDGATNGTFEDSLRLDLWEKTNETLDIRDKEFEIDFQAFVMDMAGNIGFSDSDPANPRFINDLGEKADDRQDPLPNVLGYYSAHIITLDEKDPEIIEEETATGYYGRSDDNNVPDRSGLMVVFDGPVDAGSVSTDTFMVELDDESMAEIIDVDVDGKYVFLKLASELASDATPTIDIVQGEAVEDKAGNETQGREVEAFEAQDGISPKLTVTLSGGSGTGTDNEGPSKLTKDRITIHVSSDEALQGSPEVAVVCSSLEWNEGDAEKDIDDYVANRNTASAGKPGEDPTQQDAEADKNEAYDYTCGYKDDKELQDYDPDEGSRALARPGENWEHTWQNPTNDAQMLRAGGITVVAFASDRSRYTMGSETNVRNWGSASAEFVFDNVAPEEFDLQPERDGTSKESRPFVLIEFNDSHTVSLDSVMLDGSEIADQFEMPQDNRFVYWPLSLAKGEHEVEYEVSDAAGNEAASSYEFTVEERGDFLLELQAGWNAVSVPANPVDTSIGAVFTDAAVTTVIGWDTQGWRIAVRRDGVWESNQQYGALNDIQAKYGYWVKSDKFIDQPVALKGPISRSQGGQPTLTGIDTVPGWNFVGVIDQDGDQTEDDFGTTLLDSQNNPVSASDYLRSDYIRAYTWDPTFSRFDVIRPDDTMMIGRGVWVYYEGGIAP